MKSQHNFILNWKNIEQKQIGGSKEYRFTIKKIWFDYIKNGKKIIEGRLNRGLFRELKENNIIIWKSDK